MSDVIAARVCPLLDLRLFQEADNSHTYPGVAKRNKYMRTNVFKDMSEDKAE